MSKNGCNRDLRSAADLLRLLGHPTRLAILRELAAGPRCVTDIRELVDASQPNVSQHLAALRREAIVDYYEDGNLRCYYIVRPKLVRRVMAFIEGDYPKVYRSREAVKRASARRAAESRGDAKATGTKACPAQR